MVNFCVFDIGIDATAVRQVRVLELEGVAVNDGIASLIEDFKESGFVLRVSLGTELSEDQEVLTVGTVVVLVSESEGREIEAGLSGKDTATKSGLFLIDGLQVDTSISVQPKATEHALHITTHHPISSQTRCGELNCYERQRVGRKEPVCLTYTAWILFSLVL